MNNAPITLGNGNNLKRVTAHPYLNCKPIYDEFQEELILQELNLDRDNSRGPNIEVDYFFEVHNEKSPMDGLKNAAKMILEHGTLKSWKNEGDARFEKPIFYDDNMSWITDIKLLGYNESEQLESGIFTIAYPLAFFDKSGDIFPLTQIMMSIASEPFSAFLFYQSAKIIDLRFPEELIRKLPKTKWPHMRVREYLCISYAEPIIGTIVKPKTGLTPALFSKSVVDAAIAGAKFTKADENMHLTLEEIPIYISQTVQDLKAAGFDLGKPADKPIGKRFLFAPHITTDPSQMMAYAKAAIGAGANALMFSPYYSGGFQMMSKIAQEFDVPVYAHTAGMNVTTGSLTWGIDSSVMYRLAAYFGAAFMQLTATKGYLKPDDIEKTSILEKLDRDHLVGTDGMTLVIAGGLGASNIGINMKTLGQDGRMFLAGSSVYSHPDGAIAGVKAIICAYKAYHEHGITEIDELKLFAALCGEEGIPLQRVF